MWQAMIALAGLLLSVAWFGYYAHAMQPRDGTLEWIRMYDRQPFTCLGRQGKLERSDLAWSAGLLVLVAGALLLQLWPLEAYWTLASALLSALGIYLLGRMFRGEPLPLALSAVILALCADLSPAAGPAMLAALLYYGWMCQPVQAPWWQNLLWMLGAGLGAALAAALSPAVWWMLPAFLLAGLLVWILRWRDDVGGGRLALTAVLSLLWLALLAPASVLAWGWLRSGTFAPLMELLPDYLLGLQRDLTLSFLVPDHPGILLPGLLAWGTLLVDGIRRHSVASLWLFGLGCCALLTYFLGLCNLLPVVLLAAIARVADRLWHREKRAIALLLPALTLVLELTHYFIGI